MTSLRWALPRARPCALSVSQTLAALACEKVDGNFLQDTPIKEGIPKLNEGRVSLLLDKPVEEQDPGRLAFHHPHAFPGDDARVVEGGIASRRSSGMQRTDFGCFDTHHRMATDIAQEVAIPGTRMEAKELLTRMDEDQRDHVWPAILVDRGNMQDTLFAKPSTSRCIGHEALARRIWPPKLDGRSPICITPLLRCR